MAKKLTKKEQGQLLLSTDWTDEELNDPLVLAARKRIEAEEEERSTRRKEQEGSAGSTGESLFTPKANTPEIMSPWEWAGRALTESAGEVGDALIGGGKSSLGAQMYEGAENNPAKAEAARGLFDQLNIADGGSIGALLKQMNDLAEGRGRESTQDMGARLFKEGAAEREDAYNRSQQHGGNLFAGGLVDMAGSPSSLASVFGGGSLAAIPGMDVYAQEYTQARLAGLDHEEASKQAGGKATIEMGIEAIPAGKLGQKFLPKIYDEFLDDAVRFGFRVGKSVLGEGAEEGVTELLQTGFDKAMATFGGDEAAKKYANQNLPADAMALWDRTVRATVAGMVGGTMSSPHETMRIVAERGQTAAELLKAGKQATGERDLRNKKVDLEQPTQNLFDNIEGPAPQDVPVDGSTITPTPQEQFGAVRNLQDFINHTELELTNLRKEQSDALTAQSLGQPSKAFMKGDQIAKLEEKLKSARAAFDRMTGRGEGTLNLDVPNQPINTGTATLTNPQGGMSDVAKASVGQGNPKITSKPKQPTQAAQTKLDEQRAAMRTAFPNMTDAEIDAEVGESDTMTVEQLRKKAGMSQQGQGGGTSLEHVFGSLLKKVGSGDVRLVARLLSQGNIKVVQSADQIPSGAQATDKGFYDGKTTYVVAGNLDSKNVVADLLSVAAHETKHAADISGNEKLKSSLRGLIGEKANAALVTKIEAAAQKDAKLKQLVEEVRKHMPDEAVYAAELPAYYINYALDKRGKQVITGPIRDAISAVRVAAKKRIGTDNINVEDMAHLAKNLLRETAINNEKLTGDVNEFITNQSIELSAPKPGELDGLQMIMSEGAAGYQDAVRDNRMYDSADGRKKFIVSDKDAKLIDFNKIRNSDTLPLTEVLDHPEVYKQYPALRNMVVKIAPLAENTNGEYHWVNRDITINENLLNDPKKFRSTLLHEVQHAIQQRDGREEDFYGQERGRDPQDKTRIKKHAEDTREANKAAARLVAAGYTIANALGNINGVHDDVDFIRKAMDVTTVEKAEALVDILGQYQHMLNPEHRNTLLAASKGIDFLNSDKADIERIKSQDHDRYRENITEAEAFFTGDNADDASVENLRGPVEDLFSAHTLRDGNGNIIRRNGQPVKRQGLSQSDKIDSSFNDRRKKQLDAEEQKLAKQLEGEKKMAAIKFARAFLTNKYRTEYVKRAEKVQEKLYGIHNELDLDFVDSDLPINKALGHLHDLIEDYYAHVDFLDKFTDEEFAEDDEAREMLLESFHFARRDAQAKPVEMGLEVINQHEGNSNVKPFKPRDGLAQMVFHGTPHNVDKFSLQKIGSGEGVQAFGWGLYFAGKKSVAEWYRDKLSKENGGYPVVEIDGVGLHEMYPESQLSAPFDDMQVDREYTGITAKRMLLQAIGGYKPDPKYDGDIIERIRGVDPSLVVVRPSKRNKGNLYQVDVPEDTDLLDWDKTIQQQPEAVRAAVEQVWSALPEWIKDEVFEHTNAELAELTGKEFYQTLAKFAEEGGLPSKYAHPEVSDRYVDGHEAASHAMFVAGVPGLRYLDGTSRSKGDGTSNYVIWDETKISEPTGLAMSFDPRKLFDDWANSKNRAQNVVADIFGAMGSTGGLGKVIRNMKEDQRGFAAVFAHRAAAFARRMEVGYNKAAKRLGQDPDEVREKISDRLNAIGALPNEATRRRAVLAIARDYPEIRKPLFLAVANINKLSSFIIRGMLEANPNPTESDLKLMTTIANNNFRYTTRMYAIFQGAEGLKFARQMQKDHARAKRRYAKGKDIPAHVMDNFTRWENAIRYVANHDVVIPDDETLDHASEDRLFGLYDLWFYGDAKTQYTHAYEAARKDGMTKNEAEAAGMAHIAGELKRRRDSGLDQKVIEKKAEFLVAAMVGLGDSSNSLLKYYRGFKEDRSILMKREKLPEEIRELFGEIKDPATRLAITIAKQGELVSRTRFFLDLRDTPEGVFVIPKNLVNTKPEYEKFTAELKGEAFGALNGWYTTPHIKRSMDDQMELFTSAADAISTSFWNPDAYTNAFARGAMKTVLKMAQWNKILTVVADLYNGAQNGLGSPLAMLQNGLSTFKYTKNALKNGGRAIVDTIWETDGTLTPEFEDLVRYEMFDSARAQEIRRTPTDFVKKLIAQDRSNTARGWDAIKRFVETSQRFGIEAYSMLDAWVKIAAFRNEVEYLTDFYAKAGVKKNRHEIKLEAADRVKDSNIGFSRTPGLVRAAERIGAVTFLPYFVSVYRSLAMGAVIATKDAMQAADTSLPMEARVAAGKKAADRFAGMGSAQALLIGGLYALAKAATDDDDEEKVQKMKKLLYADAKYAEVIPLGTDEQGRPTFWRLSRIDPYGPANDVVRIALNDSLTPEEKRKGMMETFTGLVFANRAILNAGQLIANVTSKEEAKNKETKLERVAPGFTTGLKLAVDSLPKMDYNEGDSVVQFLDSFTPGFFDYFDPKRPEVKEPSKLDKVGKLTGVTGDDIAMVINGLGGRMDVANPSLAAAGAMKDLAKVRKEGRDVMNDSQLNLSNPAAMQAFWLKVDEEYEAMVRVNDVYEGMTEGLGMSSEEAIKVMKDTKVSNSLTAQDYSMLRSGKMPSSVEEWAKKNTRLLVEKSLEQNQKFTDKESSKEQQAEAERRRKAWLQVFKAEGINTEE